MHSSIERVAWPTFSPSVPQAIEDRFGDRLAPGGLLVGQHEQQIDVGARRLQAAAVAAGRDHGHALGLGRILRRIEMLARELVQEADDLVFHPAQPLGAAAAVTILEQNPLGLGAAVVSAALSRCATPCAIRCRCRACSGPAFRGRRRSRGCRSIRRRLAGSMQAGTLGESRSMTVEAIGHPDSGGWALSHRLMRRKSRFGIFRAAARQDTVMAGRRPCHGAR